MVTGEVDEVYDRVGPVLQSGSVANAIVAAIKDLNQDVLVVDRGAYVRVLVPQCCVVTQSAIEKHLGRPFRFPGELEMVMSAFKGALQLNQDDAAWRFAPTRIPEVTKARCFSGGVYAPAKDILASLATAAYAD